MTSIKFELLAQLISDYIPENGIYQSPLHPVVTFKETQSQGRTSWVYEPMLVLAAQGKKHIYLDGKRYEYSAGQFLALFMPMAVECELINVSTKNPMLGLGIRLDRHRLAKLVLKMDSASPQAATTSIQSTSGIFSAPVKNSMLDAVIRLMEVLKDPVETAVMGEALIDEIYYRLLTEEQGGALRVLLQQHGQMQQISKAVEHLNTHLDKNISVDELASLINMSSSGFHKKFKDVMHVSPLQYIKSIRLNKAKELIMEGKNVSEAGYSVGYNSPAQFSREYKRQFGVAPSACAIGA